MQLIQTATGMLVSIALATFMIWFITAINAPICGTPAAGITALSTNIVKILALCWLG